MLFEQNRVNDCVELFNENCVRFMKDMESDFVDLTVTSPPYDNLRTYNGTIDQWGEDTWKAVLK